MSSLRNAVYRRAHKERSQPQSRKKYGLLEKHKDYVVRAKAFHKKEDALRKLKEKAAFRNPDEFYFKMIKTKTVDGVHKPESQANKYTQEELMLMKTQDIGYVLQKLQSEKNKIEKLTAVLQSLDNQPSTRHIFYAEDRRTDGREARERRSKHDDRDQKRERGRRSRFTSKREKAKERERSAKAKARGSSSKSKGLDRRSKSKGLDHRSKSNGALDRRSKSKGSGSSPTREDAKEMQLQTPKVGKVPVFEDVPDHIKRKTAASYRELEARKGRVNDLEKLYMDMAMQKELQKKGRKRKLREDEIVCPTSKPVYKWRPDRKR